MKLKNRETGRQPDFLALFVRPSHAPVPASPSQKKTEMQMPAVFDGAANTVL